ncbi:hypothetical protein EDF73_106168 [Raoultella sp. BIGb0138]|nr:hypothetical protein EDF73_106168 [Raoultella sp. BIGb0138]
MARILAGEQSGWQAQDLRDISHLRGLRKVERDNCDRHRRSCGFRRG